MKKTVLFHLVLSSAIMLAVFICGYFLVFNDFKMFEQEYRKALFTSMQNMVSAEAEKVNGELSSMQENVKVVAAAGSMLYEARSADPALNDERMKAFLTRTVSRFPSGKTLGGGSGFYYEPRTINADQEFAGLYAFWHEGKLQTTTEYNDPSYNYIAQDWYTAALPQDWDRTRPRSGDVYYSEPYRDSAGENIMMMTLSGIMTASDGRIIGVATVDIALKRLMDAVNAIGRELPAAYPFALDSRSSRIMAYARDNALVLKKAEALGINNPEGWAKSCVFFADVNKERCAVFYHVAETGIGIGVAVPESTLYARANATNADIMSDVGMALAAFFAVAILVFILQRRLLCRPLYELVAFTERLKKGDFLSRMEGSYPGELEILRKAMNALSSSLAESNEKLAREAKRSRDEAAKAHEATRKAVDMQRAAENAKKEGMSAAAGQLESIVQIVSSASEELSSRIRQSGQGAAEQASRVAATVAAVEEMNLAVADVAQNARNAAQASTATREKAEQGAAAVHDVVTGIHGVRDSLPSRSRTTWPI